MSDPKIISPLLDGFKLGNPISQRNGVICCPAIKENSNKKFIVKVISVPAQQSQLDALLLAGAYKDPADAMEYFRRKGEEILEEAEHLKVLSKLDGFLPFEGWQMEPITRHRLGYQIYLVGSYKRSLEKYMAKRAFTHLEAVNLGLDLCSALSVCRQSGYIYVDLKPSNIYVSEKKEYRIGDLGFLKLGSLRYASLPEHYYSPYTPPELLDPMSAVNLSADTYAVGMILYRLYNDGQLPFRGIAPDTPIPNPLHADYEMAEIIMKAISPDPEQRWLDPKDLGKAIAGYMQRNSVNDIPITPFIPLDVIPEQILPASPAEEEKPVKESDGVSAENTEVLPQPEIPAEAVVSKPVPVEEAPEESPAAEQENEACVAEPADSEPEEISAGEDVIPPEQELPPAAEETEEEDQPAEAETVPALVAGNVPPSTTDEDPVDPEISEEVAKIITKADDLIAYQIPEEALYPSEAETDPFAFVNEDSDDPEDSRYADPAMDEESFSEEVRDKKKNTRHFADKSRSRKIGKIFGGLFGILLTAGVCIGGYWFYRNIYLQTVDAMTLSATQDQITVLIDTSAEESGLVIHCSDSNGNRVTESVKGGKVIFTDLEPSTEYVITADINGFHKLTGTVSDTVKTESSTQILTFDAVTGSEAGSVILEFTVEGSEPDFWNILYSAEGEDEKRETITNHSTMITGLTVGKVYTFTLDGGKNFDLSGNKQLQYVASKLLLAENLSALSEDGSSILIRWNAPGDVVVDHWTVRCHDGYTYDQQFSVSDTQIQLTNLNSDTDYTVEVTADGMTVPAVMTLSADPVNVSGFQADESKKTRLNITWDYTGNAPEKGWVLSYTVDGSGSQSVECQKAEASIEPLIPGAVYNFTLQTADGRTVFNNSHSHTTVSAEKFTDNGMKLEDLSFDLLKTPSQENWTYQDVVESEFTDTFAAGDRASLVIRSASAFYMPGYETKVMYVLRNSYGNVLTDLVAEETYYWKNIWQAGDPQIGELNIPNIPSAPGDYVLELYFNGKAVAELDFHVTE